MSTRSTVWYNKKWHLYREVLEPGEPLYLEIVEGPFVCTDPVPPELAAIIEAGIKVIKP